MPAKDSSAHLELICSHKAMGLNPIAPCLTRATSTTLGSLARIGAELNRCQIVEALPGHSQNVFSLSVTRGKPSVYKVLAAWPNDFNSSVHVGYGRQASYQSKT